MDNHDNTQSRWKALVTGVIGAGVGLVAMRYYWQRVAPTVRDRFGPEAGGGPGQEVYPDALDLDRPFLAGRRYRRGESSTDALGRMMYTHITGQEPGDELRTVLSYLTHWGYGLVQGGVYGLAREEAGFPDLAGGLRFGTKLWLFGDEMMVPALGLQAGPTAVPPVQHANRLGAHWFFGAATAISTKLLQAIL